MISELILAYVCTFVLAETDPEYLVRNTKLILSWKQQKPRSDWGRLHSIGVSMSNGGAERVTLEALEVEGIKNRVKISNINLKPQKNAIKYARKALLSRSNYIENIFDFTYLRLSCGKIWWDVRWCYDYVGLEITPLYQPLSIWTLATQVRVRTITGGEREGGTEQEEGNSVSG